METIFEFDEPDFRIFKKKFRGQVFTREENGHFYIKTTNPEIIKFLTHQSPLAQSESSVHTSPEPACGTSS